MKSSDEAGEEFQEQLSALLASVPKVDKLIPLDDFNANADTMYVTGEEVFIRCGSQHCDGYKALLRLCAQQQPLVSSSIFVTQLT
nr:unnamed protein product [Spirometra erinaceieuropaei]